MEIPHGHKGFQSRQASQPSRPRLGDRNHFQNGSAFLTDTKPSPNSPQAQNADNRNIQNSNLKRSRRQRGHQSNLPGGYKVRSGSQERLRQTSSTPSPRAHKRQDRKPRSIPRHHIPRHPELGFKIKGTAAQPSVKHLTCYWWHTKGHCKYREEECLYAHQNTGSVAGAPYQVHPGEPAKAGKNLKLALREASNEPYLAPEMAIRPYLTPEKPVTAHQSPIYQLTPDMAVHTDRNPVHKNKTFKGLVEIISHLTQAIESLSQGDGGVLLKRAQLDIKITLATLFQELEQNAGLESAEKEESSGKFAAATADLSRSIRNAEESCGGLLARVRQLENTQDFVLEQLQKANGGGSFSKRMFEVIVDIIKRDQVR